MYFWSFAEVTPTLFQIWHSDAKGETIQTPQLSKHIVDIVVLSSA